jgi:hypothetical protein
VKSQKTTEPHVAIRRRKVSSMLLRGMNPYEITEALEKGRNALANPETNEPYSYLMITRDITTCCCSISGIADVSVGKSAGSLVLSSVATTANSTSRGTRAGAPRRPPRCPGPRAPLLPKPGA